MVQDYQELQVWQKSMDLVVSIYEVTRVFPRDELYGLTSQIRRAVVSVPSNIAEGQGRGSSREFAHFLSVSRGSLKELETQTMVARRLGYIEADREAMLLAEIRSVGRLLTSLWKSVRRQGGIA
jgi:four helix bundle protein